MAIGKRKLIEEGKAELERLLEERIDEDGITLVEIEAVVENTMPEVAAWVEERLIAEQQPRAVNLAPCPRCKQLGSYRRILETGVLTIHGLRLLRGRRYHYCDTCRDGFSPFDTALGLDPGREATRQVCAWEVKHDSDGAFPSASELLLDLRGLSISASTIERTTLKVGEQLRIVKAKARTPEVPPLQPRLLSRTYLSLDGTMLPLRDAWKRDGTAGKFHCRYGEAKLGIVFQTDQQEGLDTRVVRRECISAMVDLSRFVPQLESLAWRWRLRNVRDLVILGDGAPWIWKLAADSPNISGKSREPCMARAPTPHSSGSEMPNGISNTIWSRVSYRACRSGYPPTLTRRNYGEWNWSTSRTTRNGCGTGPS